MSKNIYNSIIEKPWGEEYCIYRGDNMSIWLLKINPNEKTSLHCHPVKKTGLILLNGLVQINLIERSFELEGFKKVIFRNGMFHQTHNISKEPIYLIEVETPDNKYDLIRIEDDYGRKNQNFENESKWKPLKDEIFKIDTLNISNFKNIFFEITTLENVINNTELKDDDMVIILGKCGFLSKDNQQLCDYGEVLTLKIVRMFDKLFNTQKNDNVIVIWKN